MANKHGLDREIPRKIQREVRQRCGFGCVVCGGAIYEYDHFDPEFKDAKKHVSTGISLLCPTDHARKGKGLLSTEEYLGRIKTPYAIEFGYSYAKWSLGSFAPQILIGSFTFTGGTSILQIGDKIFLGFEPPEVKGGPPRLSFLFHDRKGVEVFRLRGNEVQCDSSAFDIEASGPEWKVRSKMHHIDLAIRFDPPTRITIEKLHFRHKKWELKSEIGKLELLFDGQPVQTYGGAAKVSGPVFLKLAEDEAHIELADVEIVFGAGPAPLGTTPVDAGFSLSFPVFCPIDPVTNQVQIVDFAKDHQTLAVYTTKAIARESAKKGWHIMQLSKDQLYNIVLQYSEAGVADSVAFNPTKKVLGIYSSQDFMRTLGCAKPGDIKKLGDAHPIVMGRDRRGFAIRFPIYLLVNAVPETPKHEVDFAVVHCQFEALPVFTTLKEAEAAQKSYTDTYDLVDFGPKGFVKFLREIVLPRQVRYLCFNPQLGLEEEHLIEYTDIEVFVEAFRFDTPDEEIESRVENGDLRKL